MAAPVKLWDYLSFGKPVVATSPTAGDAAITESEAGILVPDTPAGLAEGLGRLLGDRALADRLAANATRYARSDSATWQARARTVLASLGVAAAGTPA
jgi:glycosyltransferase involved in cell wall biosynthesis